MRFSIYYIASGWRSYRPYIRIQQSLLNHRKHHRIATQLLPATIDRLGHDVISQPEPRTKALSLPVQAQKKQEKEMHTPYAGINLFRFKGTISAWLARIQAKKLVLEQIQAPLVRPLCQYNAKNINRISMQYEQKAFYYGETQAQAGKGKGQICQKS